MPVEVKICGITSAEDAKAALDLGADYLGFVLYAKSPRSVTPEQLVGIMAQIEDPCRAVGVFVNELRDEVERIAREAGLYAVQIHGDESPDDFRDMTVPVWRAVRAGDGSRAPEPLDWQAERYVIDSCVTGLYGGTGVKSDWNDAAALAADHKVMLSGGLNPGNVAEGISVVKPFGVDVASGVEAEPGKKDLTRLKAFFDAVRRKEGE